MGKARGLHLTGSPGSFSARGSGTQVRSVAWSTTVCVFACAQSFSRVPTLQPYGLYIAR